MASYSSRPFGPGTTRSGAWRRRAESPAADLLHELLGSSLLLMDDWDRQPADVRDRLVAEEEPDRLLEQLVEKNLLTPFQAARVATGNSFGLVLGNFRVLERIGAGGMAVVYKAEHIEMRHPVAIKVLHFSKDDDPRLQTRFSAEMRAVARLRHPNIVAAMDAGRAYSPAPDGPVLWYLVMEYVPGVDLEQYVTERGPLPPAQACNLIHQIACALAETNKLHLVHRDVKPSNILVTPEEQAKLLDFGLSRHTPTKLTQAGTMLGTIDYMAPEQARDASTVDVRADIYSLGGTLYWCLTAQLPFPSHGSELEVLTRRLAQPPPSARAVLPDLPRELDAVVRKMLALRPEDRYATPHDVMEALLPFLKPGSSLRPLSSGPLQALYLNSPATAGARRQQVLVVDDEPSIRLFCREVLKIDGLVCHEADGADAGLAAVEKHRPDVVLLDVNLGAASGAELLRQLRAEPPVAHLKVIMISGQASIDQMAGMQLAGADDYLSKPFSVPQLLGRVKAALRLKEAQDRSDQLNRQLLAVNAELERGLTERSTDLAQLRTALVLGLARLVCQREGDSGRHLERMPLYCRRLAEEARALPAFAPQIDAAFIDMLVCCAPLHDIGKVGLPDHILLKPGKLTAEERVQMQAHTTLGAETLAALAEEYPAARAFMQMASDIVRHHHERYDGTGYPDRLVGEAIPLAARIVTIADVYDALRSRRSYKPPLSHAAAVQLMTAPGGQFDPNLIEAFKRSAAEMDKVFREVAG